VGALSSPGLAYKNQVQPCWKVSESERQRKEGGLRMIKLNEAMEQMKAVGKSVNRSMTVMGN
jgi:hypothetical protein